MTEPDTRPNDFIHDGSETDESRMVDQIAAMGTRVSLTPAHFAADFVLNVTFETPDGKVTRFSILTKNQAPALMEKLSEILLPAGILSEEDLTSEIIDGVLENWYQRLKENL